MTWTVTSPTSTSGTPVTPNLRWLLGWAHRQYELETPNLEHSLSVTDDGGAPDMRPAAKLYFASSATKRDHDGRFVTPLRAALSRIRDSELRTFLRDLIPNTLNPSTVARLHSLPKWAESPTMHHALAALWVQYQGVLTDEYDATPRPSWIERSESRAAEAVA